MLDVSSLGVIAAFLAGTISFVSPCVLPLVPGYVSYIAGRTGATGAERGRSQAVWLSLCFVLGFSTIFIALGASATALGQALLRWRFELNLIGGAVVILFGLFMLGAARIQTMERDLRFNLDLPGGQPVAAYVLGLAFGFGWTPCIGPVLGAILAASAVAATLNQGIALLAVYALGLSLPFLAAALFADQFLRRLRAMRRIGKTLHIVAGVILVLTGIAMITGYLSAFGFWLLRTFPVFSTIG